MPPETLDQLLIACLIFEDNGYILPVKKTFANKILPDKLENEKRLLKDKFKKIIFYKN